MHFVLHCRDCSRISNIDTSCHYTINHIKCVECSKSMIRPKVKCHDSCIYADRGYCLQKEH